jgi:hypothetical protein
MTMKNEDNLIKKKILVTNKDFDSQTNFNKSKDENQ